ncbi:MAG TPA: hypothetical protein VGH95_04585 [Candidatus Aquirickettsiella sp.]|jgi:hypothetical protein
MKRSAIIALLQEDLINIENWQKAPQLDRLAEKIARDQTGQTVNTGLKCRLMTRHRKQ